MGNPSPVLLEDIQLATHPAVLAWNELAGDPVVPENIFEMKRRHGRNAGYKSYIYRLAGILPAQTSVIAKCCKSELARHELLLYQKVLPDIQVSVPELLGVLEDPQPGMIWLFFEDVGDESIKDSDSAHGEILANCLAEIHTKGQQFSHANILPERGAAHYLSHIEKARGLIHLSLERSDLATTGCSILEKTNGYLSNLESEWPRLEKKCSSLPKTLVHGDFVRKNVRIRRKNHSAELVVFDWEMAGIGIPGPDIDSAGLASSADCIMIYHDTMKTCWPHLNETDIYTMAEIGKIFRRVAAVNWVCASLPFPDIRKPLRRLDELSGWMDEGGPVLLRL